MAALLARRARGLTRHFSGSAWPRIDAASVVDDATAAAFRRDGAVKLAGLASPRWVEALRAAAEKNLADPGPLCDEHAQAAGTGGRFHDDQFLWTRHETFREWVQESGVAAVAARAMGSRTAHIFYDQLFVKEPGTVAPTPWHNDTSYWHLRGDMICSVWVALDDVPAERGLGYVRGSHRAKLVHRVTNFSGDDHSDKNTYSGAAELPPVPEVTDDDEVLRWDMEPGDALLFNSYALHGAPGNPSTTSARRRGYATRWCGDDVRFEERPGTMNAGWVAAGFDNGLADGAPIACALHPDCARRTSGLAPRSRQFSTWCADRQAKAAVDIEAKGAALNLEFYEFSFVDVFGAQRSKLVPASRVTEMATDGAGFAGFAAWLDQDPSSGDVLAMPDASTLTQLPWNPRVGYLACDLVWQGDYLDHAPRNALRATLRKLGDRGLAMKTGVECEFFLVDPATGAVDDALDASSKPCYDAMALMRRFDIISEVMTAMEALGWGPYRRVLRRNQLQRATRHRCDLAWDSLVYLRTEADHEDANGQFEINWDFNDALVTADRHAFFKYLVKSVAQRHGLRATFMPKPFQATTGSGCHAHISLHDATGKNVCADSSGTLGLSTTARHFVAGVLVQASALCALTNPTVNSYKRLNASGTNSGSTWSPAAATWSGNNRSALVRVPDQKRFEVRLADSAANPYLLPAALAAAGLEGLEAGAEPPPPAVGNLYEAAPATAKCLPRHLSTALAALNLSEGLRRQLGDGFVDSYVKLRKAHLADFSRQVSPWEREQYLDA